MSKPSVDDMLSGKKSRYSLVIAVAKRAREITEDAFEDKKPLEEKPVKTAVDEFANNEYKFIEDPSLRG